MTEHVEALLRDVKHLIEKREGFTGNEEALLELDFEEISTKAEELEDRIEELELIDEDYYIIDKSKLDDIMEAVMRKMLFDEGTFIPMDDEDDFQFFVNDVVAIFEKEIGV